MKKNFEGTVMQVLKCVKDKQYVGSHIALTYGKGLAAFGVQHQPTAEMMVKMTSDGEFFFLTKMDDTNEIVGYVGKIDKVYQKGKNPEEYFEMARKYSAYYYDYNQYSTVYVVENPVCIPQALVEKLLNGQPYLRNQSKKFDLNHFFQNRTNQLYLAKN